MLALVNRTKILIKTYYYRIFFRKAVLLTEEQDQKTENNKIFDIYLTKIVLCFFFNRLNGNFPISKTLLNNIFIYLFAFCLFNIYDF